MKTAQFLMVAALCSVAIGCTNADIAPDAPLTNTRGRVNVSITASTGPNTRTTVDFGNQDIAAGESVKWLEGDAISVFFTNQNPLYSSTTLKMSKISKDGFEASFTGVVNELEDGYQTVYALSPCRTFITPGSIDFTYPINQIQSGATADHIRTNMISYAKIKCNIPEGGDISFMPHMEFKQLGAMLRFQIKNGLPSKYRVKGIKVSETGTNKRLYHRMNINLTEEEPTFKPIENSTIKVKSLQVNDAPLMDASTGSYDCYMTIAPQAARTADDDFLHIEVSVEDADGNKYTRSLDLQCKATDLIKNGFDAGQRYNFVIHINQVNLYPVESFQVVTVAKAGTLALDETVTRLKLKGEINAEDFKRFLGKNSKLVALDLSDVIIENNTIPERAFNNPNLVWIRLPSSLTTIGDYAFFGARNLTDIILPEGLTSIGKEAFYGCTGLSLFTIPEGVTSIGEAAFENCESLTSVTIPEGVTSIKAETFRSCSSLSTITIHEKVREIGEHAFYGCYNVDKVIVNWTEYDSIPPYTSDMFSLNGPVSGPPYKGTISIPSGSITHYQEKWGGNGLFFEERAHIDY